VLEKSGQQGWGKPLWATSTQHQLSVDVSFGRVALMAIVDAVLR
jgi:hypothetical protein